MKKVYKAHILFTKEKDRFEVFENGYIAVEDGIVVGVASNLKDLNAQDAEVVDFGDKLLIPAMNDMHVHAPQVHNQGVAMDLELLPWLQNYTFPEESKYADVEYAERMYRRFLHTQWLFGTMRSVVFGTVHTDSTRKLMQLYQEAGMGALVGKVAMNRNCPDTLCEDVDAAIEGNEKLIAEFNEPNALVRPIITPRFVPSCTPELLKACGELAAKYQLPVQSHLSENTSEIAWVAELEPESESYGDAYNRYGLFGQTPTIMAHCVWTRGHELELMKKNGVMVAHCPTSNFNLSSGMAPIRTLLDEGVRIGLGSDISGNPLVQAGIHLGIPLPVPQYALSERCDDLAGSGSVIIIQEIIVAVILDLTAEIQRRCNMSQIRHFEIISCFRDFQTGMVGIPFGSIVIIIIPRIVWLAVTHVYSEDFRSGILRIEIDFTAVCKTAIAIIVKNRGSIKLHVFVVYDRKSF